MYKLHPLCMVRSRSSSSIAAGGKVPAAGSTTGKSSTAKQVLALQQEQLDARLRATAEVLLAARRASKAGREGEEPAWLISVLFRWSYDVFIVVFVAMNGIARLNTPPQGQQDTDGAGGGVGVGVDGAGNGIGVGNAAGNGNDPGNMNVDGNNGNGNGNAAAGGVGGGGGGGAGPNQRVGGMGLDHNGLHLKAKLVLEATGMLYHIHIMHTVGFFSLSITNVLCFFKVGEKPNTQNLQSLCRSREHIGGPSINPPPPRPLSDEPHQCRSH